MDGWIVTQADEYTGRQSRTDGQTDRYRQEVK